MLIRLLAVVMTASLMPLIVNAAEEPASKAPSVRTERVPAMRERAYKQLAKARELADAEQLAEAIDVLKDLREDRRANAYEKAMAWNLSAFVSYEMGREQDAITAYRQVLAESAIPSSLRVHTLYGLSQMYMTTGQWADAAMTLEQWFTATETPTASAYLLLGSAYYQMEDYQRALKPIQTAIEQAQAAGEVPKENAFLLLRSIHFSRNDYPAMAQVLKSLCQHYSKREYWVQLAAVYGQMDQPKKQLTAMMAAHDLSLLENQSDYTTLSQLLLAAEVPYRAAKVLEAGMEAGVVTRDARNLRTLADAWVLAKHYPEAIAALRSAATLTGDPELTLRLSQMLYEEGAYAEAVKAANQALAAGKLENGDQAHVIKGLALFEMEHLADAEAAFREAAKFDDSRQMARQWLAYIDNEQERRKALQAIRERGASRASAS